MNPFKKHYIIVSLFWLAAKIFHILESFSWYVGGSSRPTGQILFSGLLQFFIGLIVIYLMVVLLHKYQYQFTDIGKQLVLHLFIVTFFFAGTLICGVFSFLFFTPEPVSVTGIFLSSYPSFLIGASTSYVVLLVISFSIHYFNKSRRQELEKSNLETKYLEAKLEGLRAQLNPHLLFNSLNAIVSFIDESPQKAKNLLVDLSFLLRRLLESSDKQMVTVKEEISFIKKYLEIEKARFSDNLHVSFDIEPGIENASIPNLILQPLVENSLIHGFKKSDKNIFLIEISATKNGGYIHIEIFDNGEGFSDNQHPLSKQGIGLQNTLTRLDAIYNKEASYQIFCDESGVHNRLKIPLSFNQESSNYHVQRLNH